MYFLMYCVHIVSHKKQPLRPNSPGIGLQDLANKNTECLVISAKAINKTFSVYTMQYLSGSPILHCSSAPSLLLCDFEKLTNLSDFNLHIYTWEE